jgi:hypothetical protein
MARVEDVPVHHRKHAAKVPASMLKRLSAAELRYRCAHVAALTDRANSLPVPESRLALHEHARKILRSDPVAEYVEEHKRRNELLRGAPGHLFHTYQEMMLDHRDSHEHPPGLVAATEKHLLGQPIIGDAELATVAAESAAHAGLGR